MSIKAGDTIHNPVSGETFVFTQTAADTNGALLQLECTVEPAGRLAVPLVHCHPIQEERFIVKSGSVLVNLEGQTHIYTAGETAIIPAGKFHDWRNASDTEAAVFTVEMRPALRWETLFASVFASARDGRLSSDGKPNPISMALVLHYYQDHFYLQGPPIALQKMMFAAIAPFARLLGHKETYPYFTDRA
jgi:quercetin dioxygenase-like cupin family protein